MIDTIDFKKNGLNVFRLLAAIEVLYWHTLQHLELESIPLLSEFLKYFTGVPIFFTLSGFLVWQSIGRSHNFIDYTKKRFWRIYPELWIAVAIEIILIICLYHQPINWLQMGLFTFGQATIFQFWTPDFLRGYGCGTPNGALWTITVLIQFYFCAYFIYKWLHNNRKVIWGGVILASVLIGWLNTYVINILPNIVSKLYSVSLFPYLWMFILAAFVAEYKNCLLPLLKKYWWIFGILLLIEREFLLKYDILFTNYNLIYTIILFCFLLGFSYAFPRINIKTDISYGIYIYHMTIVNALISLGFQGKNWTLWVVIGITCLLAWISTVTIGKYSLKRKK